MPLTNEADWTCCDIQKNLNIKLEDIIEYIVVILSSLRHI